MKTICPQHPHSPVRHIWNETKPVLNGYPAGLGIKSNHIYQCADCGAELASETFHESVIATMKANKWEYAYALGYVSGKMDAEDGRPPEHKAESDDYAKGYVLGYKDNKTWRIA